MRGARDAGRRARQQQRRARGARREAISRCARAGSAGPIRCAAGRAAASNSGASSGFPTANLRWSAGARRWRGIFAVRVHGAGAQSRCRGGEPRHAPHGWRGGEPLLEVHLFDFDGDLYGREIEVEFVAKLRDEEHFADLDALVEQMHRDAAQARRILEAS